jgi:hypothetical protein
VHTIFQQAITSTSVLSAEPCAVTVQSPLSFCRANGTLTPLYHVWRVHAICEASGSAPCATMRSGHELHGRARTVRQLAIEPKEFCMLLGRERSLRHAPSAVDDRSSFPGRNHSWWCSAAPHLGDRSAAQLLGRPDVRHAKGHRLC